MVWHGLMADEERLEMAGAERKATPSMESADAALGDEMPRWPRVNGVARGGVGLAGAGEQDETSPEKKRRQRCVTAKINHRSEVEDKGKRVISPTFSLRRSEK